MWRWPAGVTASWDSFLLLCSFGMSGGALRLTGTGRFLSGCRSKKTNSLVQSRFACWGIPRNRGHMWIFIANKTFFSRIKKSIYIVYVCVCVLQNVLPMLYVKLCVKVTGTRSYATVVDEVLFWIFPIESFSTTSYLIFRRLLSTDSSRTSWGKRTISLSWSPWKNQARSLLLLD